MTLQYLRTMSLIASGSGDTQIKHLDLSELHVQFRVFSATTSTLNHAEITIWNLSAKNAMALFKEFTEVSLSVGYGGYRADVEGAIDSGEGIIFQGDICRVEMGKENAVDSYVRIFAQDGDKGYNWCMTLATLNEGWTDDDLYKQLMQDLQPFNLLPGYKPDFKLTPSVGALTMYGQTRDYVDVLAERQNCDWFIDYGKVCFVPKEGYIPSGVVPALSATSGLIGVPTLTLNGVNVTCLMNSNVRNGGAIQIDKSAITQINLITPIQGVDDPGIVVPGLSANGLYKVHCVEHVGDNRGQDWYTTLIAVAIDGTVPGQGPAFHDVISTDF